MLPELHEHVRLLLLDAKRNRVDPSRIDAWGTRTGRQIAAVLVAELGPAAEGVALALAEGLVGAKIGVVAAGATAPAAGPVAPPPLDLAGLFEDEDEDEADVIG